MKEQCDDGERTEKRSRAFRGKEGRGRTELIGSKITGEDRVVLFPDITLACIIHWSSFQKTDAC